MVACRSLGKQPWSPLSWESVAGGSSDLSPYSKLFALQYSCTFCNLFLFLLQKMSKSTLKDVPCYWSMVYHYGIYGNIHLQVCRHGSLFCCLSSPFWWRFVATKNIKATKQQKIAMHIMHIINSLHHYNWMTHTQLYPTYLLI